MPVTNDNVRNAMVAEAERRIGPAWGLDPLVNLIARLTPYRDAIDRKWLGAFECLNLDSLIRSRQQSPPASPAQSDARDRPDRK